jgi:microcystin-dependent protein
VDTLDLFTLLWGSLTDAVSAIKTSAGAGSSRGANAAADWAAHKRLTLPDARGRTLAFKDATGLILGGGWVGGNASSATLGATGGVGEHTLTEDQLPAHTHSLTIPALSKLIVNTADGIIADGDTDGYAVAEPPAATDSAGEDAPHANVQPTLLVNYFIKL